MGKPRDLSIISIDYPADWDVIQSGTGEIRLKVASPDGFVCGVIVREAPETRGNYNPGHLFDEDRELKNPAREKFKRAYETIMKRRLPDFEIGGQPGLELTAYPGIMVVADIQDGNDGIDGETKFQDAIHWHCGNMYKILCNVSDDEDNRLSTAIYLFIAGLTFED